MIFVALTLAQATSVHAAPAELPAMSPAFSGHDPLFQWAVWAPKPLALRLSFEGARVATGEWTLPAVTTDDAPAAAIAALRTTDYPARFERVAIGGRVMIVPESIRDATGTWGTATPLLDTRIDLTPAVRDPNTALEALCAAITARTGERIELGQILNGQSATDAGGAGVPARDLLIAILDDHSGDAYGPNLVWDLVWYEQGQKWILNVARVWALEAPSGPPPPIPARGEPAHRP